MPCAFSISSTRIHWICGCRATGCSPSRRRRRSAGSRCSARGRARSRRRRRGRGRSVPTVDLLCRTAPSIRFSSRARMRVSSSLGRARGSACGGSSSMPQPRQRRSRAPAEAERRNCADATRACAASQRLVRHALGVAASAGRRTGSSGLAHRFSLLRACRAGGSGSRRLEARRVRVVAVHAQEVGLLPVPRAGPLAVHARPPVAVLVAVALAAQPVRLGERDAARRSPGAACRGSALSWQSRHQRCSASCVEDRWMSSWKTSSRRVGFAGLGRGTGCRGRSPPRTGAARPGSAPRPASERWRPRSPRAAPRSRSLGPPRTRTGRRV